MTQRAKQPKPPTPLDLLKLEMAADLGLVEKIKQEGWAELTAAESGRLGGLLQARLRQLRLRIGPKGSLLPVEQAPPQ
ncbi:MAG TPA: small, acid-soluble spore protein, alpha/beta type [Symbiobacteriaceae bacterium]|nr:small, acid-soluble spore protein, alpha/beta type [Symbiobacteriaceae bacterium]